MIKFRAEIIFRKHAHNGGIKDLNAESRYYNLLHALKFSFVVHLSHTHRRTSMRARIFSAHQVGIRVVAVYD